MKLFSTVLLINTLHACVEHVEQTPGIDQDSPALVEFKRTLLQQIAKLERPSQQFLQGAA